MGLPAGMGSNTSEFQQALRTHLAVVLSKLVALMVTTTVTALACRLVWAEKSDMEIEIRDKAAKYQVKTEYKDTHQSPGPGAEMLRRNSAGMYRDQAKRSYLRQSQSQSEEIYTIPQTQQTMLQMSDHNMGYRGAQHHHPEELWSRQTSMDTSYNVPSIRTDMGDDNKHVARQYGRFDSIAEVTESRSDTRAAGGWRNNGYDL